MTEIAIKNQIAEQMSALRRATENAVKSKEAAISYLTAAGIISAAETSTGQSKKKK